MLSLLLAAGLTVASANSQAAYSMVPGIAKDLAKTEKHEVFKNAIHAPLDRTTTLMEKDDVVVKNLADKIDKMHSYKNASDEAKVHLPKNNVKMHFPKNDVRVHHARTDLNNKIAKAASSSYKNMPTSVRSGVASAAAAAAAAIPAAASSAVGKISIKKAKEGVKNAH